MRPHLCKLGGRAVRYRLLEGFYTEAFERLRNQDCTARVVSAVGINAQACIRSERLAYGGEACALVSITDFDFDFANAEEL